MFERFLKFSSVNIPYIKDSQVNIILEILSPSRHPWKLDPSCQDVTLWPVKKLI